MSLQLSPNLQTNSTPLIPAFCHIGSVGIKTTASFAAQLWFPIGDTPREPGAHRPFSHAEAACHLLGGESCFPQFDQLLIAIRPFRMTSKVSTARRRSWDRGLFVKRWYLFCVTIPRRAIGGGSGTLRCLADLGATAGENLT